MSLSNQQLKQIKRLYPKKSPIEISRELKVPVRAVYKALGIERELYLRWIDMTGYWTVVLLLLCSPFIFIRGLYDFADLPQRVFLQTAVSLLAVLYGIRAVLQRELLVVKDTIVVLCGLFVLWIWATVLWAASPYEAFFSVLHWSCGPLLLFFIVCLLRSTAHVPSLLGCLSAALCGTVLLGLLQALFGVTFVPQAVKPAAGFANANVAAEYVAMVLPVVIGLAVYRKKQTGFVFLTTAVIFCSVVFLLFTRCRAAGVALFVAGVWSGILVMKVRMQQRLFRRVIGIGAMVSLGAGAALFATGLVTKAANLAGGSAVYRIMVWENSLEMLRDRPVQGFGAGGFKIFYPAYKNRAVLDRAFDKETQIRRTHNDYVQMAVEAGIPGILLLTGMLGCGLVIAWRLVSSSHTQALTPLIIGMSAGMVSFMTTAFFGFPFQRAVQPVLVFVFLSLLYLLKEPRCLTVKTTKNLALGGAAIVCSAALLLLRFNVRTVVSDRYFYSAMSFEKAQANKKALEASLEAHAWNPYRIDILTTLGRAYVTTGKLEKGIQVLEKVMTAQPYNLNALFILAVAYANQGNNEQALTTFRRVLQIKPDFEEVRQIVASMKTNKNVRVNIL